MNLPENGLIVSCYLEGMKGAEREFISAVAHLPSVVGLRVEGLDNIEFARRIAPNQFIIGLIKEFDGFRNLITPDLINMGRAIRHAGADIVAAEDVFGWGRRNNALRIDGINLPFAVMWDINAGDFDGNIELGDDARIRCMSRGGEIVLATTFIPKAFDYVQALRMQFPEAKINLEGGIARRREYVKGFLAGANYVTIGKAINDPKSIIENIVKGNREV